jgi:hypothetical protein
MGVPFVYFPINTNRSFFTVRSQYSSMFGWAIMQQLFCPCSGFYRNGLDEKPYNAAALLSNAPLPESLNPLINQQHAEYFELWHIACYIVLSVMQIKRSS